MKLRIIQGCSILTLNVLFSEKQDPQRGDHTLR